MSQSSEPNERQSPGADAIRTGVLFGLVSGVSFSIWAFGGNRFGSEIAMYSACAAVFLILGSFVFYPVVRGEIRLLSFFVLFAAAFLAYAVIWCLFWFNLPNKYGEIGGSLVGVTAMLLVLKPALGRGAPFLPAIGVLFTFHSAGYFAGDYLYFSIMPKTMAVYGRLGWGILYGLGFGAGLGWGLSWWKGQLESQR